MNSMFSRFSSYVVPFAFVAALAVPVHAQTDARNAAIDRAHQFLASPKRTTFVLGYLHMGAAMRGVDYVRTANVERNGRLVPDHFALVYRFSWNTTDNTTVAFVCDGNGNCYDMVALDSTGIVNRPFVLAGASIKVLGELFYSAFQEKLTADDRIVARRLIDNSDAKALLLLALRLQGAAGG